MNRLILYCAWFSHVDFGLELSHLLLQTFGDPEVESAGAVICSDIGALFRAAAPQSALDLYRRGVQLATDRRQQIHNMWNDRMIAALTTDDLGESHQFQARIVTKVARLLGHRRLAFSHLQALRPAIDTQRKRFLHLEPLELRVPSIRPTYSGTFVNVLLNLESLAQVPGGIRQSTLTKVNELWPSDIDRAAATQEFLNQPQSSVVEFKGARLVLCAQ
jgi:hypothetical protein